MFDLAYNAEAVPVQLRTIGERQDIPPRYLEQIFQRLRKAGLVQGKRGPGGGYVLERAPAEISLLDIVEAVDGPIAVCAPRRAGATSVAGVGKDVGKSGEPQGAGGAGPDFLWPQLVEQFAHTLAATTLDDLAREATRRGIRRPTDESLSYQI